GVPPRDSSVVDLHVRREVAPEHVLPVAQRKLPPAEEERRAGVLAGRRSGVPPLPDKGIPKPMDGANEPRLPRLIPQGRPNFIEEPRQIRLVDKGVRPDLLVKLLLAERPRCIGHEDLDKPK